MSGDDLTYCYFVVLTAKTEDPDTLMGHLINKGWDWVDDHSPADEIHSVSFEEVSDPDSVNPKMNTLSVNFGGGSSWK